MNKLYPLKFKPIFKETIWGGNKLNKVLNKQNNPKANIGESWEISGVQENVSVVQNGFLKDNNIQELIEVYMGDLIGDKNYNKYGLEFPLLFKFIDANDDLSIQVHPNDDLAKKRHKGNGKTEMWYVIEAEENSELIMGFNSKMDKHKYLTAFNDGKLTDILNFVKVKNNDVLYIPAGRIHAIRKNILLAEIQQTSDITYRIYDWDRKDKNGKSRELHVDLAVDAIDYTYQPDFKTNYILKNNQSSQLIRCDYFTTNIINLTSPTEKDYYHINSFIVYMCVEGEINISYNSSESINLKKGETILIPASLSKLLLQPKIDSKILEVYIS